MLLYKASRPQWVALLRTWWSFWTEPSSSPARMATRVAETQEWMTLPLLSAPLLWLEPLPTPGHGCTMTTLTIALVFQSYKSASEWYQIIESDFRFWGSWEKSWIRAWCVFNCRDTTDPVLEQRTWIGPIYALVLETGDGLSGVLHDNSHQFFVSDSLGQFYFCLPSTAGQLEFVFFLCGTPEKKRSYIDCRPWPSSNCPG